MYIEWYYAVVLGLTILVASRSPVERNSALIASSEMGRGRWSDVVSMVTE